MENKTQSDQIGAIAAALCAAQAQLKSAEKDGQNPHFRSHYATVESVLDACLPVLNKNGIALIQRPCPCENGVELETIFVHTSGEWVSGRIRIPISKADAHGVGSAITYARRYSLAAMAGLKQGDDDGNAAVEAAKEEAKKQTNTDRLKSLPKDIADQFAELKKLGGHTDAAAFRAGVIAVLDANENDFERVRGYLRDKLKAAQSDKKMVVQGEEGMSNETHS